jgi:plasmid stabilization system protein ParE
VSPIWNRHASLEYYEAIEHYASIDGKLGERFIVAIEVAIERVIKAPEQFRRYDGEMRKVRLESFPYAVIYRIDGSELRILAVMHLHRQPGYWRDRLN